VKHRARKNTILNAAIYDRNAKQSSVCKITKGKSVCKSYC